MKLASCAEMRELDRIAIEERGIPSLELMERAAAHVTKHALRCAGGGTAKHFVIYCGTGNNGGDGLAAARQLMAAGAAVTVLLVGNAAHSTRDSQEMTRRLEAAGGCVLPYTEGMPVPEADCIVDALFGVGLNRAVGGAYRSAIEAINAAACPVVSCDIPSGVNGDTGEILGAAVRATCTVTFTCAKLGLLCGAGAGCTGALIVGGIGIPAELLPAREAIPAGRYRHFKGNEYEVLGTARHSETEEVLVVYRALYGEYGVWVRPAAMWGEAVERDGVCRPRFAKV